jgi:hypothetical protein
VSGSIWRRLAIAAVVAAGLTGGAARADDGNKAKAIALFDEGQREMKARDYAKACKAFEASNRLLPDSGTRGSLARCYTKLGKLAAAWTLWRELADTAPTAKLRADAAAQAKKLDARLAKYTIKVASPPDGLAVTVAGQPVDLSIDVPVPIDSGTYPVEATAPGRIAWKGELTAAEGKTVEVEVPALAPVAPAKPEKPEKPAKPEKTAKPEKPEKTAKPEKPEKVAKPEKAAKPEPHASGGHPGRGRRIAGLTLVSLGAVGLVVGGGFGALARSRNEDANDICGGSVNTCDPARTTEAQAKVQEARDAARISTISFVASGAAVAAGLILYVTAPKGERRAVSIAPLVDATTAGLALSGGF